MHWRSPKSPGGFLAMKIVRASSERKRLRILVLTMVCWAAAVAADAATVSNAAGVEASINGIVYYPSDNSIGVQFCVTAPTSTNITTFTIQKSLDLNTWTNYSSSMTVTGSLPLTEIGDYVVTSNQFYRMQLIAPQWPRTGVDAPRWPEAFLSHRLYAKQFVRSQRRFVFDDVAEPIVVIVPNRRIEAGETQAQRAELGDLVGRHVASVGQFGIRRLATELIRQTEVEPFQSVHFVCDVDGQADRPGLLG
jgi:hypothetical protein